MRLTNPCRLLWQMIALAAVLAAVVSGASGRALAQSVVVEAEDFGLWEGDRRVFVASGNVRVTHGDVTITASSLTYDMNAEEIQFGGNVVYRQEGHELRGKSLRYEVSTQRGWLDDVEAVYRHDATGAPVFLFGERIYRDPEKIVLSQGRLTTCEVGQPPYHFSAREVEVFPGDRIVIRGVRFVEHGITLAYWPHLTISLQERRSRFDMPRPGYSSRDGWYVKWTHNYETSGDDFGSLYVDYYQKRGVGTGVRHVYQNSPSGYGSAYVYTVGNPDGGRDYQGELEQSWRLRNGLEARTKLAYERLGVGGPRTEETIRGEASLYHSSSRGLFDLQGRFLEERRLRNGKLELDGSARAVYRLADDWDFSLRGSAFRVNTETRDARRYAYLARVEKRWPEYSLLIDVEQRIHPTLEKKRNEDPVTDWLSMHRLPEVTLSTNRTWFGLPFTLRASGGHFREFGRLGQQGEDWRLMATAQLRGYTVPLTARTSITARGAFTSYTYGNHENQLAFTSRVTLAHRASHRLRLSADYDYQHSWGSTPFNFDRVDPQMTISPRAQWSGGPWSLLLTSRYDLRGSRWASPLVGQAVYRFGTLDARLYGTYDLNTSRWQEVIATVELSPEERRRLRIGARYDVPTARFRRLDIEGAIPLFNNWRLGASMIYDVARDRFSTGFFKLTKDLGCREFSISYDHLDKEIWLEYHIFAFPMSRVRVGRSEDDETFLFEHDLLRELLEE